jgi:hypothetical protein
MYVCTMDLDFYVCFWIAYNNLNKTVTGLKEIGAIE